VGSNPAPGTSVQLRLVVYTGLSVLRVVLV